MAVTKKTAPKAAAKKAPAASSTIIQAGRGLGALLAKQNVARPSQISESASLSDIEPDPDQPRKTFDDATLAELAESVKKHGLLQPIIVTPAPAKSKKKYRIVAGERRFHACKKAGLTDVPVRVVRGDERLLSEIALVENIQREDLNPIETAVAIKRLMDAHKLTQEQAAGQLGIARAALANKLRLLSLPEAVQTLVIEEKLTEGHAKVLLSVKNDEKTLLSLANSCVRFSWSVRTLEAKIAAAQAEPQLIELWKPKGLEKLNKKLGFRVSITGRNGVNRMTLTGLTRKQVQSVYALLERESKALKSGGAK